MGFIYMRVCVCVDDVWHFMVWEEQKFNITTLVYIKVVITFGTKN